MKGDEALSGAFREAREALGLSQRELAKKAGVPYQVVRNLEGGLWEELPEPVYMRCFMERMADVLQLSPKTWKSEDLFQTRVDLSSVVVAKVASPEFKGWRLSLLFCFLALFVVGAIIWRGWEVYRQGSRGKAPVTVAKALSPVHRMPSPVVVRKKAPPPISQKEAVPSPSLIEKEEPDQAMAAQVEFHQLEIRARERCWVWMRLGDGSIKDFILKPQERFRVSFFGSVEMRVGNSGALTLSVDGRPLPFQAKEGQPKNFRVTPEGIEE